MVEQKELPNHDQIYIKFKDVDTVYLLPFCEVLKGNVLDDKPTIDVDGAKKVLNKPTLIKQLKTVFGSITSDLALSVEDEDYPKTDIVDFIILQAGKAPNEQVVEFLNTYHKKPTK